MKTIRPAARTWTIVALLVCCPLLRVEAGTLTGSFSPVASGSNINLTILGAFDWVQWGLGGDHVVNRKAGITPLISNFTLISLNPPGSPLSFSAPYWFEDTGSSFSSWEDGYPLVATNSNYSRVLAYSYPVAGGSGFRLSVPADTTTNTLSVFVGTQAARGELRATLSGQPNYFHSPGETNVNGVYTINYAANAPGRTLTIEWTLPAMASNGNVTLQAAALTAPNANNPPFALLTQPASDATFTAPANIVLDAIGEDFDGTVTNVAFYANANQLGQDANSPFSFNWSNPPVGYYLLAAVATDDRGSTRPSVPVEIFVHGTNGSQAGAIAAPAKTIDLTTEGTSDWVHWGLETNAIVNRKAGVAPQISDFTPVGTATVSRYADNYTAFSWSDGTPTFTTGGTPTGVFLTNLSSGFQLTLPADTKTHLLRLYVGAYAARGRLLAYLSDFSARPFIDQSVFDTGWDNKYAVYSITYNAASAGQQLIVSYRSTEILDVVWGNVTLQAATLQGDAPAVLPVSITNALWLGGDFVMSFNTQTGQDYTVEYAASLPPPAWSNLVTVPGNGGWVTVTNQNAPAGQRYFRVRFP